MLSGARHLPIAFVVACVLVGLLVQPAAATFPGRNGAIVITKTTGSPGPPPDVSLLLVPPDGGRIRELPVCSWSTTYRGETSCRGSGPVTMAPDGDAAAAVSDDGMLMTFRLYGNDNSITTRVLAGGPVGPHHARLRWSPDGSQLLLQRPLGLSVIGPDGVETGRLLAAAANPDWSSDGRLAFQRRSDIYTGRLAGPFRRLTYRGGREPSWSPHGRWIAFARKGDVYVVPSRGGRAHRIARTGNASRQIVSPVWSPDGKLIAFYRRPDTGRGENYLAEDYLHAVEWKTRRLTRIATHRLTGVDSDVLVPPFDWQALPR